MEYIHINCDLGEGRGFDEQLMPLISACNIACGGHAGNLRTMRDTVRLALEHGVEIGAHPSYPDKNNFGRKSLKMYPEDLKQSLLAQMLSLKQTAEAEGGKLQHVKPHGALYNDAAKDEGIASIVLQAVLEFDEELPLYVPENSRLAKLAGDKVRIIYEAFADRNYEENYQLVSRERSDALITDKKAVFKHLLSMFRDRKITCPSTKQLSSRAATFCIHSDTPDSVEILEYLHKKIAEYNIKVLHT